MQRFQSSSMALNHMFHFVFHCVPPNLFPSSILINISRQQARRFNKKMKLTIIHRNSQFISIQFNPIHFNSMNPYSIQFNSIQFNSIESIHHSPACTSGGTFSAVATAAAPVTSIIMFNSHHGVLLLIDYYCWLHSCWH